MRLICGSHISQKHVNWVGLTVQKSGGHFWTHSDGFFSVCYSITLESNFRVSFNPSKFNPKTFPSLRFSSSDLNFAHTSVPTALNELCDFLEGIFLTFISKEVLPCGHLKCIALPIRICLLCGMQMSVRIETSLDDVRLHNYQYLRKGEKNARQLAYIGSIYLACIYFFVLFFFL